MSTINVQLSDGQGGTGSKEFPLASSVTTVAGAQAALDDLVAIWPALSGAGLSNPTVSFPLTMTPIAAQPDSNLDEGARVRLAMASGVGNENHRIPAPSKTGGVFNYIVGGAVDVSDTAITDYFDLFATGDVFRIGVNALRAVASVLSGYKEAP